MFTPKFQVVALAAVLVASSSNAAVVTLYSQDFDGMTTSTTAALPTDWRFAAANPTWGGTTTAAVTKSAGTTGTGAVGSSSAGGDYLWVNGVLASGTDKAIGFLTSTSFSSPRSIMMSYTNNTGYDISSFTASWDYEKYRSGTRAFDLTFFSSTDGTNWTAVTNGNQSYAADANNTTIFNPPTTIAKSASISQLVANGGKIYFRWTYTGNGGSTNAQGIGIDNFILVPAPGAVALLGMAGLLAMRRRR